MDKEIKELLEKIEDLDWAVTKYGENQYTLSKFSPAGQDFNITVEGRSAEELIESIYGAYEDFDVSEETFIFLDNTGHGKNGAPYEMRDVLEDMEACEQMILDLYNELIGVQITDKELLKDIEFQIEEIKENSSQLYDMEDYILDFIDKVESYIEEVNKK